MKRPGLESARKALVLGGVLLASSVTAWAADSLQGTITAGTQKVTLSHGLASIDAKGAVFVGFFGAPLNAEDQKAALRDYYPLTGIFKAPHLMLDLSFNPGAKRAQLDAFGTCHYGFLGFEAGIFDFNNVLDDCGPVAFSGDLKPGGVIHGKLKGHAKRDADGGGPAATFVWDVEFTATLRAKP
jgi:hypothetical protein